MRDDPVGRGGGRKIDEVSGVVAVELLAIGGVGSRGGYVVCDRLCGGCEGGGFDGISSGGKAKNEI
jgi:hypothetical protein